MSIKSDFITQLRQTPAGVDEFLTAAIPALSETTLPTDKESAIVTQGILAHNINLILMLFVGLTPIELLLRIGQHSNVAEAICLSGLEYLTSTDAAHTIAIQHPQSGKTYQPGELRIIVTAPNGTPAKVTAVIGDAPISLDESEGTWTATVSLNTETTWTLEVTAEYAQGDPATASCTFAIDSTDDDSEPPGGKDKAAVQAAKAKADKKYATYLSLVVSQQGTASELRERFQAWKSDIQTFTTIAVAAMTDPTLLDNPINMLNGAITRVETEIENMLSSGVADNTALVTAIGVLQTIINQVGSIVNNE